MSAGTVLIVGDEAAVSPELHLSLEEARLEVVRALGVNEAMHACMDRTFDLALVSLELPPDSGLAVLEFFRGLDVPRYTPVFLLADRAEVAVRVDAFRRGCDELLLRPVEPVELLARVERRLAVGRRLDDLLAERDTLKELAVTDGLTGVANHRTFQERLREEFRRAQRYDDPLALILLDVDHFKAINDQLGHQAGDEALRGVASAVRQAVRETDFAARYGGEEFAVILPKTHLAGALTVAERIGVNLRRLRLAAPPQPVTASFGLSGFPARAVTSPEQLIRAADEALLRSKREGRNKISLHQPALGLAVQ